jgi:hypothetical protein
MPRSDALSARQNLMIPFWHIAWSHLTSSIMMPNVGQRLIHTDAVALIRQWISEMKDLETE